MADARDELRTETPDRPTGQPGAVVRLLFTCTANRVRSPFAAAVAGHHVTHLGLPVEIRSAGLLEGARPAIDEMVNAARRRGFDLSGHSSTRVSRDLLEGSDLVVTMTGQHVLDLTGVAPSARSRIITLKEWAAATEAGRHVPAWTPESVREWAATVAARPLELLLSGTVDIDDPIGRPARFYRRAAEEIETLLDICFAP